MLTDRHHLYTGHDLRRDELDLLVKALTELYRHTFSATVLVQEYIAIISSHQFLYRLIRSNDHVGLTQTDSCRHIHTRAQQILRIRDHDLRLEGMTRCINSRINHLYGSWENLIRIDLRSKRQLHSLFESREIRFGDGYKRFEFIDLREHKNRLTAIQFTILVILGGDNTGKRSFVIRINLKKLQLLFGGIILRQNLVILLLSSRTRLEKLLNSVLLNLQIGHRYFRGLVLSLIHINQGLTLTHSISHFAEDMLDLTRKRRSYVQRDIALQVG